MYRKKGSVSGDNKENVEERIYLVTGEASVRLNKTIKKYKAPSMFRIPAKTYHKIDAVTDITMIIIEPR